MRHEGPFGGGFPSLDRDMAKGIMKIVVLSCIKKSKTYPYALLRQMKKHGSPIADLVSKSDVYNITTALERDGFIRGRTKLSGKKALKIYTITEKGAKVVRNKDIIFKRTFDDFRKLIRDEFNE